MVKSDGIHIAKKIELWSHIKRFGQLWKENEGFIAEYAKDVYNAYKEDLDAPINCFKGLICQSEWMPIKKLLSKPLEI